MNPPEPIIYLDPETKEFKLNEDQYEIIFTNPLTKFLPVSIISIAGDCRKGKSFLLNFFLRYLKSLADEEDRQGWTDIESETLNDWIGDVNKPLEGFSWRPGVDSVTVGIIIWPEPLIVTRSDGQKIAVLLMDTQGLFDDKTGHRDVGRFFAISSLISSVQICNQLHQLQSNDLTTFTAFSSFGKQISGKTGYKAFQKLLILIRDWSNPKQFNYGSRGGQEYLEYKRQSFAEYFGGHLKEIEHCYEEIACFLLPSIGDDACTDEDFDGRVSAIRPAFIIHLQSLVKAILSPDNLIVKTLDGEEQELWMLGNYISELTDKLKANDSVEIDDLLVANDETKAKNAVCTAYLHFMKLLTKEAKGEGKIIGPEILDKIERDVITLYESKTEFVLEWIKNENLKELQEHISTTREIAAKSKNTSWIGKLHEALKNSFGKRGANIAAGGGAVVTIGGVLLLLLKTFGKL